jgi:RNA polymerase sigma-70 factor (ECF subfamily)
LIDVFAGTRGGRLERVCAAGLRYCATVPAGAGVRRLDPELLADHVERLYRAAYGLCRSTHDAEDLVQDTFERVLRRPRFLRRDQDLAYLLRVLRNTWISRARSQRVPAVSLEEAPEPTAAGGGDPVVAAVVEAGAVYEALHGLSEPLREAVVAVDIVGLSYREAARALGTKEGTIMSRLHRGRSQIASQIGPHA